MIKTIDTLIEELQNLRKEHGNMFIKVQAQIGAILDIEYRLEDFYNENKTVSIKVIIIEGYIKRK